MTNKLLLVLMAWLKNHGKNSSLKREPQVIYIPGLGDGDLRGQRAAIKTWRLVGVEPHFFDINWSDDESFDSKLKRLLRLIDELHTSSGLRVGLVGPSAGATVVLQAFAARQDKVSGVVCICGKIQRPEAIWEIRFKQNPAFRAAAFQTLPALDDLDSKARTRILSLRPLFDEIVAVRDTLIEGANNKRVFSAGHAVTITLYISLLAWRHLRFLKKLA